MYFVKRFNNGMLPTNISPVFYQTFDNWESLNKSALQVFITDY